MLQQRWSAHALLLHSAPCPHTSPSHFGHVPPPQSSPVSAPFLFPSEQLMHVRVAMSQLGCMPTLQSPFAVHATHALPPLHTFALGLVIDVHAVPFAEGGYAGPVTSQALSVQGLLSSTGRSAASSANATLPLPSQIGFLQSLGVFATFWGGVSRGAFSTLQTSLTHETT